ncbi:MAG: hypothetical protein AAF560_18260 [Acidobacteriota bacterium]
MDRETLRHVVATLAYRTRQILEEVPEGYPDFDAGHGVRSPLEILKHMSSVLCYASLCFEGEAWQHLEPLTWEDEKQRFEDTLHRLDEHLRSGSEPHDASLAAVLQGPICDCMTHVGQLATLRRMAGAEVPGENFMQAPIQAGELKLS